MTRVVCYVTGCQHNSYSRDGRTHGCKRGVITVDYRWETYGPAVCENHEPIRKEED